MKNAVWFIWLSLVEWAGALPATTAHFVYLKFILWSPACIMAMIKQFWYCDRWADEMRIGDKKQTEQMKPVWYGWMDWRVPQWLWLKPCERRQNNCAHFMCILECRCALRVWLDRTIIDRWRSTPVAEHSVCFGFDFRFRHQIKPFWDILPMISILQLISSRLQPDSHQMIGHHFSFRQCIMALPQDGIITGRLGPINCTTQPSGSH